MEAPFLAAVIGAVFLLAGLVKGVIGLGLPTVAMGLLGLAMPPVQAAALLVVPSLVTNVWQMLAGPRFAALARRFATMMFGVCVGTALGIGLLTGGANAAASTTLGVVLAVYGVTGLLSPRLAIAPRTERWASPIVGLATGVLTGATGVFVIPSVPYVAALGLERDDLVQTLGLSFTVSTAALGIGLAASGAFPVSLATTSLIALAPALAGMWLGQALRARLSPSVFQRCFFAGLVALGGYMVVRATGQTG